MGYENSISKSRFTKPPLRTVTSADQNSPGNSQKPSKCQRTYKSRRENDFHNSPAFSHQPHTNITIPRNGCTKLLMGRSFCNYSDRFFSIKLFDLRAFLKFFFFSSVQ